MNEIIKRNCIICGKEFKIRTTRRKRVLLDAKTNYRNRNAKTCTKKCSRIFTYLPKKEKLKQKIEGRQLEGERT